MSYLQKYNVPGPRYTSYPTVPYWNEEGFSNTVWEESVRVSWKRVEANDGISVYVHLPFCESLCTYCGCNTRITVNHLVEKIYIHALLEEWKRYLALFGEKPRIRELHLGGGTPTFFSAANLGSLVEALLADAIVCEDAEFSFEAHPGNTSKEHLEVLYELGFRRISLGVQDFDPIVQETINRLQSVEQVAEITSLARQVGYSSVNFDLIYGLPKQTVSSIRKTMEIVRELRPDRIAFYSYAHVPWLKPGQRKFTEQDLPAGPEKSSLYEAGKLAMQDASYHEIGMDHFALCSDTLFKAMTEGTLHRNFMGYTNRYTPLLIGLGASSISETEHCYAQNAKKVEEYYQGLRSANLPVWKGHLHTRSDSILRRHILNIICRMETSWSKESDYCVEIEEARSRLAELEKDGLVQCMEYALKVMPAGRPFLRNICMAFDARLWSRIPKTALFSHTL